jgi:Flp pilus assembly protein TadD
MSANPSQQRVQQGHAARRAGRTAALVLSHRRRAGPRSAEANSVYGLMLLQVGRADEAETPLRRAVEIAPTHAALRMNLAQWLTQQQRLDEAVGIVAGSS